MATNRFADCQTGHHHRCDPVLAQAIHCECECHADQRRGTGLPEIVKRALVETVVDIGQLSDAEKYQLNKHVKKGWLSKGQAGPFPKLKTVYACPGFDFVASRERYVAHAMMLAELDAVRLDPRRRRSVTDR